VYKRQIAVSVNRSYPQTRLHGVAI